MKATCVRAPEHLRPYLFIRVGDVVDFSTTDTGGFVIDNVLVSRATFFFCFKTNDPKIKMSLSDLSDVLCNRVFTMAMFSEEENADGSKTIVINNWNRKTYYVVDKRDCVEVVFSPYERRKFSNYQAALDSICYIFFIS